MDRPCRFKRLTIFQAAEPFASMQPFFYSSGGVGIIITKGMRCPRQVSKHMPQMMNSLRFDLVSMSKPRWFVSWHRWWNLHTTNLRITVKRSGVDRIRGSSLFVEYVIKQLIYVSTFWGGKVLKLTCKLLLFECNLRAVLVDQSIIAACLILRCFMLFRLEEN